MYRERIIEIEKMERNIEIGGWREIERAKLRDGERESEQTKSNLCFKL